MGVFGDFPGSPPVPPLSPFIPRDPPFPGFVSSGISVLGFSGSPHSPRILVFGVSGNLLFPPWISPFFGTRASGIYQIVSIPCAVPEGISPSCAELPKKQSKKGCFGGVKKCQKRVKKGGKSKMTFSKCGRRGQNSPYPPTSHEKSAK